MNDLRFLHIPKTAGSTFAVILIDQYGLRSHFNFIGQIEKDRQRWNELPGAKQQAKKLFLCHSPMVTGIDKVDRARIITFLRDPVSRVQSFCQHVYEGKSPYLKTRFTPFSFTANDLLHSGEQELDNMQVNVLAGTAGGGSRDLQSIPSGGELLDLAWKALTEQVFCYGLLEQFDRTILLFKKSLGWTKNPYYVRVNKKSTARQLEFSTHDLEKIKELNLLDIALYERARSLFDEQAAQLVSDQELVAFQQANSRKQLATACRWLPLRMALKLERFSMGST